jgi:polygalacturonase
MKPILMMGLCALAGGALMAADFPSQTFDIKAYGAKGDGVVLDSGAINKAIDAARAAGGGTVYLAAGTYLSGSIHLQSNVALYLGQGSRSWRRTIRWPTTRRSQTSGTNCRTMGTATSAIA